jgi:hypothetical protein
VDPQTTLAADGRVQQGTLGNGTHTHTEAVRGSKACHDFNLTCQSRMFKALWNLWLKTRCEWDKLVIKYDAYLYLLQSNIHFAVSLNI